MSAKNPSGMSREELIRVAFEAIDEATSAVLTDHIIREAAVEALIAVGLIEEAVGLIEEAM